MASIITSLFRASSLVNSAKSLIAQNAYSKIGDLVIDAVITEVISYSSSITEHPIETKTAISDHIFKQPLKVKIEGYITDSPLLIMGLFETPLQNNSLDKFINNVKSFSPFTKGTKPSQQAYQLLKNIHQNRQLINVVTKLDAFSNMAIESLSFNNNVDTGGKLEFTADLLQVVYASVRTTTNVNYKNKVLKKVTEPTKKMGDQQNPEELKSVLQGGTGYIGSRFPKGSPFPSVEKFLNGMGEALEATKPLP